MSIFKPIDLNGDVVNLVVNETDSYYKYCSEQNTVHKVAKKVPYRDTSVAELYAFFCSCLSYAACKEISTL